MGSTVFSYKWVPLFLASLLNRTIVHLAEKLTSQFTVTLLQSIPDAKYVDVDFVRGKHCN